MRGKSKPLQSKRRDEAMDVDDDQVRLVVVVIVVVVVMGFSVIVVRFKVVRGPVIVCVSTGLHHAHPVSVPILPPRREIPVQALWSLNSDTDTTKETQKHHQLMMTDTTDVRTCLLHLLTAMPTAELIYSGVRMI